jgi:hypothetical protein
MAETTRGQIDWSGIIDSASGLVDSIGDNFGNNAGTNAQLEYQQQLLAQQQANQNQIFNLVKWAVIAIAAIFILKYGIDFFKK